MYNEYELAVKYDNHNSFYGKAVVRENEDGTKQLFSYETEVAYIENGKAYVIDTYSSTMLRHIKEFLKQNGYKATTKKQIEDDYMGGNN